MAVCSTCHHWSPVTGCRIGGCAGSRRFWRSYRRAVRARQARQKSSGNLRLGCVEKRSQDRQKNTNTVRDSVEISPESGPKFAARRYTEFGTGKGD